MNTSIAEARATYNRSYRQWIVADGNTIIDALAPGCQEQAQLAAMRYNNPALADEVEAIIENNRFHPEAKAIESRTIKAGLLIQSGNVMAERAWRDGRYHAAEIAAVRSQSDANRVYGVYFTFAGDDNYLACECEDHGNGLQRDYYPIGHPERPRSGAPVLFNGQIACKHILAILICQILGA